MATWVEIPAPGDLVLDATGKPVTNGPVATLKLAASSTDATHADQNGNGQTTGSLIVRSDGTIGTAGARRFVQSGQALDMTVGGVTRRLQPIAASVEAGALQDADRTDGAYPVWSQTAGKLVGAKRPFRVLTDPPYKVDDTGATDASATINTAFATPGTYYLTPGAFKLSSALQMKSGVRLIAAGRDLVTLDASGVAASANTHYYGIQGLGSVGAPSLLTVDAKKGDMQVAVASAAGLAAGDQVVLASDGPRGVLNGAITSGATSIVVTLTAGTGTFSARGYLAIEDEQVGYSSVSIAGNQATFTIRAGTLGRGAQGTTAAAHSNAVKVYEFNSGKYILWRPNAIDRGEIKRIASVSGSTLLFEQPLNDDYPVVNAASIRKVTPVANIEIRDLTVVHSTALSAHIEWGIGLEWCDNVTVENCGAHYAGHINIGLNNVTRFRVSGNRMRGKAVSDPGGTHALYGVATYNACQWGTVSGNHVERAFKMFTASSNTSGQSWWGQPRDITVTGNTLDNAGVGFVSRHPAYEVHGAGERITIVGNTASGCESVVSIQTAGHVVVKSNTGSGWYRAGLIFSGAHELHTLDVAGNDFGSRTVGTGRTTLTADPGAAGTTISVADTSSFIDDTTTPVNQLVQIDSEIIRVTGATSTTFTGCTRGYMGTTAAAHSIGATVLPLGNASACPIDIDLSDCVWGQRAYNQPVTATTVDPGTGGTTITVADTTGFPAATAAAPQLAVIEGENAARNFEPEVISYTGLTGTTLTGVTRGLEGTPATAHTVGVFVMPYEIPVTQLKIEDNQGETDLNYYGIIIRGYAPTRQVSLTKNQVFYTGLGRPSTEGLRVECHSAKVRFNELYGWLAAGRAMGNAQTWRGNEFEVTAAEQTTGYGVRVEGTDCRVLDNQFRGLAYGVQIGAANLRTIVKGNVWEVPNAGRGILSADTTTVARDNIFARFTDGSTTDLAVTAAATLSLPTHGNHVWRVAGTTGITAVSAQADGTIITLRFTGALTVTTGTALKLNGAANLSATADDVIQLVCDGTNWRQVAPVSAN